MVWNVTNNKISERMALVTMEKYNLQKEDWRK